MQSTSSVRPRKAVRKAGLLFAIAMGISACGWRVGPAYDISHLRQSGFDAVLAATPMAAPDYLEEKLMEKLNAELFSRPLEKSAGVYRARGLGADCSDISASSTRCEYTQYVIGSRHQRVSILGNRKLEGLFKNEYTFVFLLIFDSRDLLIETKKETFSYRIFQEIN